MRNESGCIENRMPQAHTGASSHKPKLPQCLQGIARDVVAASAKKLQI
jgi:hypothetical protein